MIFALIGFPLIKITHSANQSDSPFYGEEYNNMNWLEFSKTYIQFSYKCIFNQFTHLEPSDTLSQDTINKLSNHHECTNAWGYIIAYTICLFVIQLNLNSILHHKFARQA